MSPKPGVRLWAKLEGQNPTGSVKDRIAKRMIEDAEASGALVAGKTILEPTSGNTGIALGLVARRKGYRLTVVIPDNASEERIQLLELFGAEIVLSPGDEGTNGSIDVARRLAEDDRYFMPFQYRTRERSRAREGTARRSCGTCPRSRTSSRARDGALTGVGRRLHRHDANIKVIAAEPELGELVYGLRSLDDGFVPPILDERELDRKFLVSSSDALRATRELTELEGIFAGISSGAVLHVARRIAGELERGDVVCLLADGGWKYLSVEAWAPELERAEKHVAESRWW
jgi:cysteine synthase B